MEAEENQISVWVCREEKVVSGLSRRTTCADVLRVLMEGRSGSTSAYCLVEKWRGFERVLPNKTKLLRLWSAWGDERGNVRFVLVRQDASLASSAPRSAEARLVPSRQSPRQQGTVREATMALSPDKQRRVVRKAFRKLERINRRRARALSKDAERMETLVHLVVSQDHTIRQQVARIQELDREIELCEARVHLDRVRTHGVNYVQETYMMEADNQARPLRRVPQDTLGQLEEYAQMCEEVVRLQEELSEREVLLDSITRDIQEELNQRWMKRRREPDAEHDGGGQGSAPDVPQLQLHEDKLILEEERIKTQLDTSLYIGLRLNTDLEAVKGHLDLAHNIWGTREQELRDLQEELSINRDVQAELNQRWMTCRQEPGEARHGGQGSAPDVHQLQLHEDELLVEEERIKTQLDTSLYIGLRLNTDLETVKGDLDLAQNIWGTREQELRDLLEKVDSLDLEEDEEEEEEEEEMCDRLKEIHRADQEGTSFPNVDTHGVWVEQARGLSSSTKTCNQSTDDDSDTGLSSMHSQDSDITPVYESLV